MTTPTGLKAGRALTAALLAIGIAVLQPAEPTTAATLSHEITGVSDLEFTVTWLTETAVAGSLQYGTSDDALVDVAHDDRGQTTVATTHHVTVSNLSATTTYYYRIVSDGTAYDDNGSPYELTTGPSLAFTMPEMISGRVLQADGTTPAAGAVVYVVTGPSQTISTLTGIDGQWAIDIAPVRMADYQGYQPHSDDDTVAITVRLTDGDSARQTVTIGAAKTGAPNLTPSVTLLVDFTANPTSVQVGDEVQFSETASGGTPPYSYSWDLDNDGTVDSTEAYPTRAYDTPGTYGVTLRVTDSQGVTDTTIRTDYISVSAPADDDDPPVIDAPTPETDPAEEKPTESTPVAAAAEDGAHHVTNVVDRAFTVSWTSPVRERGYLRYGLSPERLTGAAYDQRGQNHEGRTHHVTVVGLEPNTIYHFEIVAGSDTGSGVSYEVTTGPELPFSLPEIVTGKAFREDGATPAEGAIAYVSIGTSQVLSSVVNDNAIWAVEIGSLRTGDLQDYFTRTGEDVTVDIADAAGGATSKTVALSAVSTATSGAPVRSATDIVEESDTAAEFNWWLVAGIAAGVVIIGAVIWQLRIRRY